MPHAKKHDLCPCGSGEKYCNCCRVKDRAARRERERMESQAAVLLPWTGNKQAAIGLTDEERTQIRSHFHVFVEQGIGWDELKSIYDEEIMLETAFIQYWKEAREPDEALVAAFNQLCDLPGGQDEPDPSGPKRDQQQDSDPGREHEEKDPLKVLIAAGDRAVPYLGTLAHQHVVHGIGEAVWDLPQTVWRDRLVMGMLHNLNITTSDKVTKRFENGTASMFDAMGALTWLLDLLDEAGVPYNEATWTILFTTYPQSVEEPARPLPGFADALGLLWERGHKVAVLAGLRKVLDPDFLGVDTVRAFLNDPRVDEALRHLKNTPAVVDPPEPPGRP